MSAIRCFSTWTTLILIGALLPGCGRDEQDARIAELEKRLTEERSARIAALEQGLSATQGVINQLKERTQPSLASNPAAPSPGSASTPPSQLPTTESTVANVTGVSDQSQGKEFMDRLKADMNHQWRERQDKERRLRTECPGCGGNVQAKLFDEKPNRQRELLGAQSRPSILDADANPSAAVFFPDSSNVYFRCTDCKGTYRIIKDHERPLFGTVKHEWIYR
jgi:hypothetical protein